MTRKHQIAWTSLFAWAFATTWITPAVAQPKYDIVEIGLTGAEHTRDDGTKFSQPVQLNAAGQVRGYSTRYNGGSTSLGRSSWLYDGSTTLHIGLFGAEHTRNDGYKYSEVHQLNEAGQVRGYSDRYNGGSTQLGRSAWLYDGGTTLDIGLTGAEHTRNDGFKESWALQLNEAGQVSGYSLRFNGGSIFLGQSAWLYNGSTTLDIGLTGVAHTRNDGYKYSLSQQLNQAGQVRGQSIRYNGGSDSLGSTAWLYDGSTTLDIGLTGAEHTSSNGIKNSESQQLNEAGQVRGYANRYNGGNTFLGYSAWLYDGSTTFDIGLVGAEHTRNDGYKESQSQQLNQAGQVGGYSERYNGASPTGRSAWLYDGSTTLDIGLTGAEHTRNDGYKFSQPSQLNQAGQVSGYSERYSGASPMGRSAWLYDGSTTLDIGLTGAEHTSSGGYKYSNPQQLNVAGQVTGISYRYSGSSHLGQSAWLYDGSTTLDIGLVGAEHTRSDGWKESTTQQLNAEGQVRGYSLRYDGAIPMGRDAWVYDFDLGTVPLQLSVRDDGYAYSEALFLSDDGIALGFFNLYDGMSLLGERAFYWSAADGLWDLGLLVDGGLDDNGWQALYRSISANGLGQIIGYGIATGLPIDSRSAYLLTPVPEPSTWAMALSALAGLGLVARRRR